MFSRLFNKSRFKKLSRNELHKAFPGVTEKYVDNFYDLYYWSLVGFLSTAYEEELHIKLQLEFDYFLKRCDQLTQDAADKAAEEKKQFKMSYPVEEMNKWFYDHP